MTFVALFLFGLAMGSFLNVVALRYTAGGRLVFTGRIGGRSHCPACGATLRWFELLPLVSFLMQGGKCRSCRAPLSWRYPAVELVSGVLTVLIPFFYLQSTLFEGWVPMASMIALLLIGYALLLMTLIDLRHYLIPDQLTLFIAVVGGFYAYTNAVSAQDMLLGSIVGFGVMGLIYWITQGRGLGFGDVKLAAAFGLMFGWQKTLMLIVLSFVIGALVAVPLLIRGKKGMKDPIPFGPFLAIAFFMVLWCGEAIVNWYLSLIFP